MSRNLMAYTLLIAFAQAFCTGAVSAGIFSRDWPAVFTAAFVLNWLWWVNVGNRIDLHGRRGVATLYALTFASGVSLGAWVWR